MPTQASEIATFARIVRCHQQRHELLPTKRELAVAYLGVVHGLTINQVAARCVVSPKTIETQRRRFIQKLGYGHAGVMWGILRAEYAEAMEHAAAPVT